MLIEEERVVEDAGMQTHFLLEQEILPRPPLPAHPPEPDAPELHDLHPGRIGIAEGEPDPRILFGVPVRIEHQVVLRVPAKRRGNGLPGARVQRENENNRIRVLRRAEHVQVIDVDRTQRSPLARQNRRVPVIGGLRHYGHHQPPPTIAAQTTHLFTPPIRVAPPLAGTFAPADEAHG